MPASDNRLRQSYANIAEALYDQYGIDAGWPGIVPWPVTESIVDIESAGDNLPANDAGAIGLMQIVPTGGEADYYHRITGEQPNANNLTDERYNLQVGIAGLANDEIQATKLGYPGWHYAGQMYFGGFKDGAPNDEASDGYTRAGDYRSRMVDYWRSTFGDWTANYLQKDSWFSRHGVATTLDEQGRPNGSDEQRRVDNETYKAAGSLSPDKWTFGVKLLHDTEATIGFAVGLGQDAANSAGDNLGTLFQIAGILTNPDTWIRVSLVIVGMAAVTVGMLAVSE